MTLRDLRKLQKQYEVGYYQEIIDNGMAWKMEGRVARKAMEYLSIGACFLPLTTHNDYWGNEIPARTKVKSGSMGSLLNSKSFWTDIEKYTAYFSDDENAWAKYIMSKNKKR